MKTLLNVHEYEKLAAARLPKAVFDFFSGGALDEITLRRNIDDFAALSFTPRILNDVSSCNTATTVLKMKLDMPLLGAPMAFQTLAHTQGEIGLAKALAQQGLGNIVSTMSSQSLEDIRHESPNQAWFQLYLFKDRALTLDLLARAESAGYQGIVLTVDAPIMGKRERDIQNHFHLPSHISPKNFSDFHIALQDSNTTSPLIDFVQAQFDRTLTWKDVDWLKSHTSLPIILKGIAHPDDAALAITHGIDAIIISNHGGRQLDSMPSSIALLQKIVAAGHHTIPLLMDGGVRRGADILKALLLGATAVLVGRPLLWGLAVNGQTGVNDVLTILKTELIEAMMLTGISDLSKIHKHKNILCQDYTIEVNHYDQ